MSGDPIGAGLSVEQAPPLSIPLRFFLSAPLFMALAGGLALSRGGGLLVSRYMPATLAFVHCITLGVLSMVVLGALYQMTPVVAGSPVPRVGLARAVHALFVAGVLALLHGVLAHAGLVLRVASVLLALAWLAFALPVGLALLRSPARAEPAVRGMQLAVASMLLVVALGGWLALSHAGAVPAAPRAALAALHLGVALLGFLGALIVAVTFQVMPMFYLAPALPAPQQRALLIAVGASVSAACVALIASQAHVGLTARAEGLVAWAFLPAVLAVWVAHPVLSVRALRRRKRKRGDPSLRFFFGSLGIAPVCALLACIALLARDPRWPLAFGFVTVFGWALGMVHGMLYRIVPFLVWFHRLSALVGVRPVPSALRLLPDAAARAAFYVHAGVVLAGCAAIALRSDGLVRVTGALTLVLALLLGSTLWRVARYQPPA